MSGLFLSSTYSAILLSALCLCSFCVMFVWYLQHVCMSIDVDIHNIDIYTYVYMYMVLAGVFMAVYYFFVEIFHSLFIHEVSDFGHCK